MLNYLLLILLSPLILLQGIYVRRVTPKLADPDGAREGLVGQGKPLSLLIIGDSAGLGVGVDHQDLALSGQINKQLEDDHAVTWKVVAKTGDTTSDTIEKMAAMPAEESFDVALISLGVNDITSGLPTSQWLEKQRQLREILIQRHGIKHIISSGMPPMYAFPALPHPLRWILGRRAIEFDNKLGKELSPLSNCHYLKIGLMEDTSVMSRDGFHPGEQVYAYWGSAAAEIIRELDY